MTSELLVLGWLLAVPIPWLEGAVVAIRSESASLGLASRRNGWWAVLIGSTLELGLVGVGMLARVYALYGPTLADPDPWISPYDLIYTAAFGLAVALGFVVRTAGIGSVLWGFGQVLAADRRAIAEGREVP